LNLSPERIVQVALPDNPYPVVIGSGVRRRFSELFKKHARGRAFWVSDRHVADAWGEDLGGLCTKSSTDIIILPPGEQQKRMLTVERICQILLQMGAERSDTLVACGGGVVGDLTGFAAAVYLRGVEFVQVPTTLLAMVDASVGGKTAVDLPEGKNLIGAFHQPRFVLVDVAFLETLDERQFKAGYAEVVKTALIGDKNLYDALRGELQTRFLAREPDAMTQVIEACVRYKADVVARDEKESDLRRILNFGHTFAHALEAFGSYTELLHGEAVFWGISAAVDLSVATGCMQPDRAIEVREFMQPLLRDLPRLRLKPKELTDYLYRDKKVKNGKPHFVLLEDIGKPIVSDAVGEAQIEAAFAGIREKMSE
jgi:3-dehydroquinate synthase